MSNQNNSIARPFSDNLVDLHVSVVPMKHWVEKLNYASHKVIGETFSVGFIRVLPDTPITLLRGEISKQLGTEVFPEDYVFLKHVGRCLALVRQSQEKELKVKNFLPPHSIMPEIFILPGRPAMYSYKVLPPIHPRMQDLHLSSSGTTVSNETNFKAPGNVNTSLYTKSSYKYNDADILSQTPTQYFDSEKMSAPHPQSFYRENGQLSDHPSKSQHSNTVKTRIPSSARRPDPKSQQRHVSGKSNYENDVDPASGEAMQYKKSIKNDDNAVQSSVPLLQTDDARPSLVESVLREGPRKRKVHYSIPSKTNASTQDIDLNTDPTWRDLHQGDAHRFTNQMSSESDSSFRSETHLETRFMDSTSNRNGQMRKQLIDTSTHVYPTSSNHTYVPHPRANNIDPHQNGVSSPHAQSQQSPTDDVNHSGESRHEPDVKPTTDVSWQSRDQSKAAKSNSANNDSGYVDNGVVSDSDESYLKTETRRHSLRDQNDPELAVLDKKKDSDKQVEGNVANREENQSFDSNPVPSSTIVPKAKSTDLKSDDVVESKSSLKGFRSEVSEGERADPVEEVNNADQRTGSSAKFRLWEELQKIRSDRRKAEKSRQDLVQHAKVVTSKINQKRSSVRDAWKKKFFEEKKKTLPLEDTCRRLQGELDSSHRRLVTAMETNKPGQLKKFSPVLPPTFTPSHKNNSKIQAARLQHDIDILRRRIEDAKIKLTGEIKLRHQAEQDVKGVRQELLTKKIRAHLAYREMNRTHGFPLKA